MSPVVGNASPFAVPPAPNMPGTAQLAAAIGTESGHFPQHDAVGVPPERGPVAALLAYANEFLGHKGMGQDSPIHGCHGLAYAAMCSGSV